VPVFPCKPDKSPHTGNGFKAATTDEGKIRKWWETWPDALIGVPTGEKSGINVLDIDVKTGSVEEVLSRLPETLPETRVHETRSGGRH
jgi:putative DNA primase/helicase